MPGNFDPSTAGFDPGGAWSPSADDIFGPPAQQVQQQRVPQAPQLMRGQTQDREHVAASGVDHSMSIFPQASPGPMLAPQQGAGAMGAVPPIGARSQLGVALTLVLAGTLVGVSVKRDWRAALAGALAGGACMNGYRAFGSVTDATPDGDREAMISGTFALLGGAAAAWIGWKISDKCGATGARGSDE